MRKITAALTALAVVLLLCPPVRAAVGVHAASAILMDAESGRVLFERDAHHPRLIASTTKLLTALVAAEQADDLDEVVTIKGEWLGVEGSSIYLQAGEEITLRGLLYGLLLQSGNDAAMAIACHIAGSEGDFAALMNQKAEELGMKNSSFANPSGLNDDNHYSTAYDMALLGRACLENETVAEICATRAVTVGTRTFINHNKLLSRYEGCVGMKTGFTEKAGRTLVSAATRDGQTLICVTLNDGDDWNDHAKLLDYGFATFPRQVLCRAGEVYGWVPVEGSLIPAVAVGTKGELGYPLTEAEKPVIEIELPQSASAPLEPGARLGELRWLLDGKVIARMPLVSRSAAGLDAREPMTFWERVRGLFGGCVTFSPEKTVLTGVTKKSKLAN